MCEEFPVINRSFPAVFPSFAPYPGKFPPTIVRKRNFSYLCREVERRKKNEQSMILSYYFIRKRVQELLRNPIARRRRFFAWGDVKRIWVVYLQEDNAEAEACVARLRAMGKEVRCLVFAREASVLPPKAEARLVCTKADLNLWAFPSEAVEKGFCAEACDVLLDLVPDENLPLQYLEGKHPAPFKLGVKKASGGLYDFALEVSKRDIGYIFEQMLFYLQTFRSE